MANQSPSRVVTQLEKAAAGLQTPGAQQNVTLSSAQPSDLAVPVTVSARQDRAIVMILSGATDSAVAQELGVSRYTVWRWRQRDPQFIAELNMKRSEMFTAASNRLRALAGVSIKALENQLATTNAFDVFRAARFILQFVGDQLNEAQGPCDPDKIRKKLQLSGIEPQESDRGDEREIA